MNAYSASPQAYRQSAILTAPPEQLVVMLYDGARRFLFQAAAAMRAGNIEVTHNKLRRAEDIIVHLRSTLDLEQGGDVAQRLSAIYSFCIRHLSQARITRDATKVDEVSSLLSELREAWGTIASA
jgi:flagellar protein FliS